MSWGQPGMVLMREIGFPTARFDVPFRKPEQFRDREGGVARAKREVLEQSFANDFSGGSAFYRGLQGLLHSPDRPGRARGAGTQIHPGGPDEPIGDRAHGLFLRPSSLTLT